MKQAITRFSVFYFLAMAVALTFPGVRVANRIEPFVLGIPFVFVWSLAWILGALVVLIVLYRAYHR